MPSMSVIERTFCRSHPWRLFATRVILPWALQGLLPEGDLLELGAGSGGMASATTGRFPDVRVTVTDIDPVMVHAARQRLADQPRIAVQQADVTQLPFADHSFDCVASYLMLHHVIDWRRALTEAARVLRRGGKLVGYDLTDTRAARLIHRADRSPHQLIPADDFAPALTRAGLTTVAIHQGLTGHVVRFIATKPL
jgi:ubiquinone/menaquinone biosynthesis C-methylase UbiE